MLGSSLLKDRVTLVKKDGTVFRAQIPASVQPKSIFINDGTVPIESGDHILRHLPSNLEEDFIVTDATYMAGGSLSHWEIKYRRSNVPLAPTQKIVNNITGNNARVNIGSTDNSSNTVIIKPENLFSEIIASLQSSLPPSTERDSLILIAEEMRDNASGSSFKERYQKFVATAANHMTVIAPFLPALTHLL